MPKSPRFWWRRAGPNAWLFAIPAWFYGRIAGWRMARPGVTAPLPVICVGNLVAGGAGKTPTAISLVPVLRALDLRPGFLSRGYGGEENGPLRVDPQLHTASDVGDEALLLAGAAPTVVARDRPAGARLLAQEGIEVIVMDDGFQNPSLEKDLSLIVVDSTKGVGNGMTMPAGPLRAPLRTQLSRTDAVIVVGHDHSAGPVVRAAARIGLPVLHAHMVPVRRQGVYARRFLAFAGIGHPEKFFETLRECGADLISTHAFADHEPLSEMQCQLLLREAREKDLIPITTEKDIVRLRGQPGAAGELAEASQVFPVKIVFDENRRLSALVAEAVRTH